MVRAYRSRDEIIVDILKAASVGARKTHIMQRANLNPLMLHKYFPVLLGNGLIVVDDDPDGGSMYALTDKGKQVLKMYRILRAKFRKDNDVEPVPIL